MNLLRGSDQQAYDHVTAGRLGSALAIAERKNDRRQADRLRSAVAMQCRQFVVLSDIEKAEAVRLLAKRPHGDTHLPTALWPSASRVANETLVEPAILILKIAENFDKKEAARLDGDDRATSSYLREKALLPGAPVANDIFDLATDVRRRLAAKGFDARALTTSAITYAAEKVILLITADFKGDFGNAQSSFVDFHLGLNAVEFATLLAREVLIAFENIEIRAGVRLMPAPFFAARSNRRP